MKMNKNLDKFMKNKVKWLLNYREFAYILVNNTDRKVWENLVELSDMITGDRIGNFPRVVTDGIKWALTQPVPIESANNE